MNYQTVASCGHQLAVSGPFGSPALPNVVFLHGITGTVGFWDEVIPGEIRTRFRWAAVSLPAHFCSTITDAAALSNVDEDIFGDSIAGVIREVFHGEPVHLVGWSTGGFSALMIAAKFPDLVVSVSSVSGFVRGAWGNSLGMMQRVAQIPKIGIPLFVIGMKLLALSPLTYRLILDGLACGSMNRNRKFQTTREAFRKEFAQHDFSLIALLFAGLRRVDATTALKQVSAPCLVIGGRKTR